MLSYVSNIWKEIIVYTIIYAQINANMDKDCPSSTDEG